MIDMGGRCEKHVGEVFPPRCFDCEFLNESSRPVRSPLFSGGACPLHREYPWPCALCERIERGLY